VPVRLRCEVSVLLSKVIEPIADTVGRAKPMPLPDEGYPNGAAAANAS
jgi:hypothetical protein